MKLIKRKEVCGICTSSIWFIPLTTYLMVKTIGDNVYEREWVWWILIPILFLFWLTINYKIKTNND